MTKTDYREESVAEVIRRLHVKPSKGGRISPVPIDSPDGRQLPREKLRGE